MTITIADAVMTSVRSALLDPSGVYWTDTELLGYYSIVQTAIISENPTAITKNAQVPLVVGVEQQLPGDAVMLGRASANVASGFGISQAESEDILDARPNWYRMIPVADVIHIIPDEYDKLKYRVYPPNDGTGVIYMTYPYAPEDPTSLTDPFLLTEAYRMSMWAGILGMSYAKNSKRGDNTKAEFYFNMLDAKIAAKLKSEETNSPKIGTYTTTE